LLVEDGARSPWRSPALDRAWSALPDRLKARWIWWRVPEPPARRSRLLDVLEPAPRDVPWHAPEETERLLSLMAPLHRRRLQTVVDAKGREVGALYRRTRPGPDGRPQQRVEIRFDGVAGCLRTPAGGSSRQTLMIVEDGEVRSRLISGRETARLMGLPDSYRLPARYGDAYHLTGDGVVVDVVRHLAEHLLAPLAGAAAGRIAA
jgi:DNA (cytosine-5)-methyltransferase 1